MNEEHFLLHNGQKSIQLRPERATFYLQGEIIEAYSEKNEAYYLFFYKYQFLAAAKAKRLRRHSFIQHAFTKGMVCDSPHPFIHELLVSNQPLHITNFNQLLEKLDHHYSPQEKAFILTFFESFIPKKLLLQEIKSAFYEYRRNGQSFLGYQILHILNDFSPNNSLVKQLNKDMMFTKYANLYKEKSNQVFSKDVIFAEKTLYSAKDNDLSFQQLITHLEKESRWIDMIALFMYKVTSSASPDHYHSLIKLLKSHLNDQDRVEILEGLSRQLPEFHLLQQDLFDLYLNQFKSFEKIIKMLKITNGKLKDSQVDIIQTKLEEVDPASKTFRSDQFSALVKPVFKQRPEIAEEIVRMHVVALLKTNELPFIKDWLEGVVEKKEKLTILDKIEKMEQMSDDLDQMQPLGELYYEFEELEKAVECFSWVMELQPNNPNPVKWISKIYREMGRAEESDAYRQLCVNMQKEA